MSSQELSRFLHLHVGKTFLESLPLSFKIPLICRLLADPSFITKMSLDNIIYIISAITYQYLYCQELTFSSLCLCCLGTVICMISHSFVLWYLAPSRNFFILENHTKTNTVFSKYLRQPNSFFEPATKF